VRPPLTRVLTEMVDRAARWARMPISVQTRERRFVIVQIDGLSHAALERALSRGHMSTTGRFFAGTLFVCFASLSACLHRLRPSQRVRCTEGRTGPPAALHELRSIDASIADIWTAIRRVPELGYDLFILSDHGQTLSIPFETVSGTVPWPRPC